MYQDLVALLGLLANVVMAGAAVWVVFAARKWREDMTGKSTHQLALDASIVAKRIEQTWCDVMDRWSKLAPLGAQLLREIRPGIDVLYRLDAAIPELTAKMDALGEKEFSAPLRELHKLIVTLTTAVLLDLEQRSRPDDQSKHEPYATTLRLQAGFSDPEAAKAGVTDLVALVVEWADPHLGIKGAAKPKAEEIAERVRKVTQARQAREAAAARSKLDGPSTSPK